MELKLLTIKPFAFLLFLLRIQLLFLFQIPNILASDLSHSFAFAQDVTYETFGQSSNHQNIFPVSFGDYDSDKKTDLLVVNHDFSSFEILFGSPSSAPPFFQRRFSYGNSNDFQCNLAKIDPKAQILSLNMADFNGDGINDILVAYSHAHSAGLGEVYVKVLRGTLTKGLDCENPEAWLGATGQQPLEMTSVPLIWDYNQNMIADLVGEVAPGNRKIWEFHTNHPPTVLDFTTSCLPQNHNPNSTSCIPLVYPLIGGYVDIDGDFSPELVLISTQTVRTAKTNTYVEIYSQIPEFDNYRSRDNQNFNSPSESVNLKLMKNITLDADFYMNRIGNPLFLDLDLSGGPHQILIPYCQDKRCHEPRFLVVDTELERAIQLDVKFEDSHGQKWTFLHENLAPPYTNMINVHAGDFNLDGYPDLAVTLMTTHKSISESTSRSVLFLNVNGCKNSNSANCGRAHGQFGRTFKPEFHYLDNSGTENYNSGAGSMVLATAFFDYEENGLLDIIGVKRNPKPERTSIKQKPNITYSMFVVKNTPEYDAYFIKGLITSGRRCGDFSSGEPCLPYGVLSLGASMKYSKINLNNQLQCSRASQVLRSNYALDLPTTVLGTGASANFIDSVTFGIGNRITTTKTQVIPNSFLIAIPPEDQHESSSYYFRRGKWEIKYILNLSGNGFWGTLLTLGFISSVNLSIVFLLQWRERKEDLLEKSKDPITMGALRLT